MSTSGNGGRPPNGQNLYIHGDCGWRFAPSDERHPRFRIFPGPIWLFGGADGSRVSSLGTYQSRHTWTHEKLYAAWFACVSGLLGSVQEAPKTSGVIDRYLKVWPLI